MGWHTSADVSCLIVCTAVMLLALVALPGVLLVSQLVMGATSAPSQPQAAATVRASIESAIARPSVPLEASLVVVVSLVSFAIAAHGL